MYAITNSYSEQLIPASSTPTGVGALNQGTGHVSVYNYQKGIGYDGDG